MKNRIRMIAEAVLAVLFLSASYLGYYKDPPHMWEYCFLSGIAVGILFLAAFLLERLSGKRLPEWLYLSCTTDILIILIATATLKLNLKGAFWFIHIINPVLLFSFYILFCDAMGKLKSIAGALIFPLLYIAVSYIRMKLTGLCAFPADRLLKWEPQWIAIPMVAGVSVLVLLFACGLYLINKRLHRQEGKARA